MMKKFKKVLTKRNESDIISKLSPKRDDTEGLKKSLKKLEKSFKKVLTKGRQCDIILRSPRERRHRRSES